MGIYDIPPHPLWEKIGRVQALLSTGLETIFVESLLLTLGIGHARLGLGMRAHVNRCQLPHNTEHRQSSADLWRTQPTLRTQCRCQEEAQISLVCTLGVCAQSEVQGREGIEADDSYHAHANEQMQNMSER